MLSVFDYLDYRDYLRDWFEERKKQSPWYSYKVFGEGVSLDQSQVYRITQKQLHISAAARDRFVKYLGLSGASEQYFLTMIDFSRTRREAESRRLFVQLQAMRGTGCHTLVESQYGLYEAWFLPVVRALLGVFELTDDYASLAARLNPPISVEEARKAVATLAKLKLVARDKDGVWRLQAKSLSTGSQYQSQQVRRYQAQTFKLLEESLERHPRQQRDINVANLAVDASAFKDCIEILASARRQIRDRIERIEQPDRIMRLATCFFPVAGPFAEEKSKR